MGSAPAPGAVFRARPRRAKVRQRDGGAENIGRSEISRTPVSVTRASGWTRGASSNTRGGCAPQLRN
ncbi:MAG: hypothetical protein ABSA45_03770, partial [Verrucomicrobiota bacterium]